MDGCSDRQLAHRFCITKPKLRLFLVSAETTAKRDLTGTTKRDLTGTAKRDLTETAKRDLTETAE